MSHSFLAYSTGMWPLLNIVAVRVPTICAENRFMRRTWHADGVRDRVGVSEVEAKG